MVEFLNQNMWVVPVVLAAILVLFFLFRPRQRVHLSDDIPVRPHMSARVRKNDGRGLTDEAAAAASDMSGTFIGADVHGNLPGAGAKRDDLVMLKGIGPKLAQSLNALGYARFDQLARLTPNEVARLDGQLGAFRGRLTRDRVVEQAEYLARGDIDGFEQRFGKL